MVLSGLRWATEAANGDRLGSITIGSGHPGGQAKSLQMAPYPVGVDFRKWPPTLRATVCCPLRQDVVRLAPSFAPHVKAPPHVRQDVVRYTPCHLRWPIMPMDRGLGHPQTGIKRAHARGRLSGIPESQRSCAVCKVTPPVTA